MLQHQKFDFFFFFFFKATQPHKVLFFPLQRPFAAASSHLSLSHLDAHPDQSLAITDTRYLSKQPLLSSALCCQYPANLLFSSTFFCPHSSHTAWHSAKSWCEGERGNLLSTKEPEKHEGEASDICVCLWAAAYCLMASAGATLVMLRWVDPG